MKNKNETDGFSNHESGIKTYIIVWALLIFFTGLTVTTANLNLGRLGIAVCLAVAAIKSTIVFLYFMHLRHEKRLIIKLLIPGTLVLLAVFIGLTFTDVLAR